MRKANEKQSATKLGFLVGRIRKVGKTHFRGTFVEQKSVKAGNPLLGVAHTQQRRL